ncbi:hypothetical protein QNO08_16465 [Arthrobacter sp. zg-Y820]|uniref:hypothetical protein n=1 Tax=unclassified Arthrobacter TaxID=235627 RepID=UPI001E613BBC|nr:MULTISPECIES: hypothetical protein [unclassified Arthrobacter]MCC9197232.1 hypothetical protein [Arthrobacter sp. zg-Y820]MDK1280097.1 hypothetical protein [Arthrobacter sp. zg.Y820]WIB09390.1 hypothetical protein QNO08_16465 [Arthrobacter sp. zg-Y820]
MSPEQISAGAVDFPRLLAAAAFLTNRATEESLAELRLTQERTIILGLLTSSPADAAALATASGLAPGCVDDCVRALECCGYATIGSGGRWTITSTGAAVETQARQAEVRLLAGDNDDGLRRDLSALIRALTPSPESEPKS